MTKRTHIIIYMYTSFFKYAIAGLATLLLSACTSHSGTVEQELQTAETALTAGQMQTARSAADHLTQTADSAELTASMLARLSMVYIRLAEHPDYTDMAVSAVNCYRKAFELNPDSAKVYFDNLDPEQTPTAAFLYHMVSSGDADYDIGDYPTDTDSIPEIHE